MQNPSYLIKSRHDVYYFRYPFPVKGLGKEKRVSISLRTRCPREALRLAKMLEYHSLILFAGLNLDHMDNAEILQIIKDYYAKKLDGAMQMAENGGFMAAGALKVLQGEYENMNRVIDGGYEDYDEMRGVDDEYSPYSARNQVKAILEDAGLDIKEGSDDFEVFKHLNKFAARNFLRDWIAYNEQQSNFSLLNSDAPIASTARGITRAKLGEVLEKYLDEIKPEIKPRSFNEQRDCLSYLIDWLGEGYPITKVNNAKAQEVKELLRHTPKGRNKEKRTKELKLLEQISVAKDKGLRLISVASVNKYLAYFDALFKWAERNRYIEDNPFAGIRVKGNKKKNRRDNFTKEEVAQIIKGLGKGLQKWLQILPPQPIFHHASGFL